MIPVLSIRSVAHEQQKCESASYLGIGLVNSLSARFRLIVISLFALQGLVWISLPLLFDGSIRRDVAEGVVDGQHWQLSYLRHPPLSTWLTGIASTLGPYRYIALYTFAWALAAGAFVLLALFLARSDKPQAGIVALLAGLASPFATYVPLNLNHNITVMFFWALTLGAAWRAFSRGGLGDWLLFGAAAGFGLWAKYALLHLVLPLVILFWFVPEWRRQAAKLGPWLAILLCLVIIAPHMADALAKGSTTLQFALHTSPAAFGKRLAWAGEFALDCALSLAVMALLAVAAAGGAALDKAWHQVREWHTASRFEQFLTVAAFGPVAIVLLAALADVKPHFLWQTPFNVSFAAFWGHAAANAGTTLNARRLSQVFVALAALLVVSFISVREIAPIFARRPYNQETNGPELAALAQRYWAGHHSGRIPFLVSLNAQHGFQAAASIAFDLPYRVETLEDGDPTKSPWFDAAALKREGALVVMINQPADGVAVLGLPVGKIETFERPVLRGARPQPIIFGELQVQQEMAKAPGKRDEGGTLLAYSSALRGAN